MTKYYLHIGGRKFRAMAIAYELELATQAPAAAVAERARNVLLDFGLIVPEDTVDDLVGPGVLMRNRSWIKIGDLGPSVLGQTQLTLDFGIEPNVFVVIRLDTSIPSSAQDDDMVAVMIGILGRVEGDAVLHYEYEVIWLVRRAGELVISSWDDVWLPKRLALVTVPFRRESLIPGG